MRALALPVLLGGLFIAAPAVADPLPLEAAKVIATYPHDRSAYTEGLFYRDGSLFESTGMEGSSTIRQVDIKTGTVRRKISTPPSEFGEGIVDVGDQIVSLTWKNGHGYRWSLGGFKQLGTFQYAGEGWALTKDAHNLIMSDGTPTLRFLDPKTLRVVKRLKVTADGNPVANLNELEYVDGDRPGERPRDRLDRRQRAHQARRCGRRRCGRQRHRVGCEGPPAVRHRQELARPVRDRPATRAVTYAAPLG
jgi:glutamine cyclotransferase